MARRTKKVDVGLPGNTIIDVVAILKDKVYVSSMTFDEAKKIKKKRGWTYRNYMVGFHSFKNTESK